MLLENLARWRPVSYLSLIFRRGQLPVTYPLTVSRFCKVQQSVLSPNNCLGPTFPEEREHSPGHNLLAAGQRSYNHCALYPPPAPYTCQTGPLCSLPTPIYLSDRHQKSTTDMLYQKQASSLGKRKSHQPSLDKSHKT